MLRRRSSAKPCGRGSSPRPNPPTCSRLDYRVMTGTDYLDLVDWRRRVGDLYRLRGPDAAEAFRRGRDDLFRNHPQSPIEDRATFAGLDYFPVDPAYRTVAVLEPADDPAELVIDTGGEDGAVRDA